MAVNRSERVATTHGGGTHHKIFVVRFRVRLKSRNCLYERSARILDYLHHELRSVGRGPASPQPWPQPSPIALPSASPAAIPKPGRLRSPAPAASPALLPAPLPASRVAPPRPASAPASTESRSIAAGLQRQGPPAVCVVPPDAQAVFRHEGVRFVACPATRPGSRVQCSSCGGRWGLQLCAQAGRSFVVTFAAHGARAVAAARHCS